MSLFQFSFLMKIDWVAAPSPELKTLPAISTFSVLSVEFTSQICTMSEWFSACVVPWKSWKWLPVISMSWTPCIRRPSAWMW